MVDNRARVVFKETERKKEKERETSSSSLLEHKTFLRSRAIRPAACLRRTIEPRIDRAGLYVIEAKGGVHDSAAGREIAVCRFRRTRYTAPPGIARYRTAPRRGCDVVQCGAVRYDTARRDAGRGGAAICH